MSKQVILNLIEDSVSDFLYYDRKEDDQIPSGYIDMLVVKGDFTIDENDNIRWTNIFHYDMPVVKSIKKPLMK